MAGFVLNNVIFDRVVGATVSEKNGKVKAWLSQLSNISFSVSADPIEIEDAMGNIIYRKYNAKNLEISATNAFISTDVIALTSGSDMFHASEETPLRFPKIEEIPVETTTLKISNIPVIFNMEGTIAEQEGLSIARISQILQNVMGDKIVSTMVDYVSRSVAEQINYITAEAFYSSIVDYEGDGLTIANAKKIVAIGEDNPAGNVYASVPDAMAQLICKIGNADPLKGDTSFNDYKMSQVISNTLFAKLMATKGQFILESSYGQEILIDGTLGRITLGDLTSYKGRILGVDTFVLPDAFFPSDLTAFLPVKRTSIYGSKLPYRFATWRRKDCISYLKQN